MTYVAAPSVATVRAPGDAPGFYSVSEAATLLGVNRVTIWRWIRDGRLPASRLGHRTTRIAREDLERALSRVVPIDAPLHSVPDSNGRAETADGPAGEHVAQFYVADEFVLNAASDFVGAALRAG
ncbi:MAG: helix-turn-helix domain-containing protein, partial [Chloroflexota bacterium]|nr:helix-turn-helix domain-containing protein [Chloroflexota bacterium]